jgi:hypothetical protein
MADSVVPAERSLQDLLTIENDPAILDFRCPQTDLLLWPLIRVALIRVIMSDLLYGTPVDGLDAGRSASLRAATTLLRSITHNALTRRRLRADVCIFSTAVANQLVDGSWFNRLTDPFALQHAEGTITVEEPFEWQWHEPRHHQTVHFLAPRLAIGAIAGRLLVSTRHRRIAAQLVDLVLARALALLGWSCPPARRAQLIEMLARKMAALPMQYGAFSDLLDEIRPRILLVTAGCYGPLSPLLVAANRRAIVTAEYQHGAVSSGHDAYNVSSVLAADDRYRESLPQFFLGYGTWWNAQFNAPVTRIALGNPHRDRQLARVQRHATGRRRLLILSDGIEFSKYLEFAEAMAVAVGPQGYDVILRPHPLERTTVAARHGDTIGTVSVDREADLYASLATAHAVTSEVSTGLFEAVGIADRIMVWDTPKSRFGYPVHPFERFTTVDDLVRLLAKDEAGRLSAAQLESIWASDWQAHYVAFLAEAGVTAKSQVLADQRRNQ